MKLILLGQSTHSLFFGPGGLRAPPGVADGSKVGHCFHLFFSSFSSFSTPSTFHSLQGISRARKFVSPNILA